MDHKEIWHHILLFLETELSKPIIATFFGETELVSLENGLAKILCPNRLSLEHLRTRYEENLIGAIQAVSGQTCKLAFEVRPLTPNRVQELGPIFKTVDQTGLVDSYTFENFVIGLSNQLAVSVAQAVVEKPGQLHNPLFLYSGVGLGKTHLLHAVGNRIKEATPEAKVLYASAERFTSELIRAIQDRRTTASFRKRFRAMDVLLIDDIQFLAGREATQEEFFNTFNELYLAGKQIILTSDRRPAEIPRLEQRLVSRFAGGVVADIQEPDLDMRAAILRQKATAQGAHLQEDVILTLAEKIEGSIRQLEGALNQLLAVSSTQRIDPSAELARGILQNRAPAERFLSSQEIIATVGRCFHLTPEELRSSSRIQGIVLPRQIAAYLLRKIGRASLNQIGQLLGGKDHSTILHGIKKIERELPENQFLQNQVELIRGEILGKNCS
jgi:chromosomal replication initiator protein